MNDQLSVELNETIFVEALLDGIMLAADTYFTWSRGFPITDYGTEHVMNVMVAQKLYDAFGDTIGLILEEILGGITEKSKAKLKKGRMEKDLRSNGRVDIAVFDKDDHPYAVIEGKRGSAPSYVGSDIGRISAYIRRFGSKQQGSLKRGALISLSYFDPAKADKLRSDMKGRALHLEKEFARDLKVTPFVRFDEGRTHKFEDGNERGYAAIVFLVSE